MSGRPWTRAEERYLVRHRSTPIAEQAEALGRSGQGVVRKRAELGLAVRRDAYTPREDDYLRKNEDTPLIDQAIALGRPIASINSRRAKLRLGPTRRNRPWSESEDRCVRECCDKRVAAWRCGAKIDRAETEVVSRRQTLGLRILRPRAGR